MRETDLDECLDSRPESTLDCVDSGAVPPENFINNLYATISIALKSGTEMLTFSPRTPLTSSKI
jgi:hypothetical protein